MRYKNKNNASDVKLFMYISRPTFSKNHRDYTNYKNNARKKRREKETRRKDYIDINTIYRYF